MRWRLAGFWEQSPKSPHWEPPAAGSKGSEGGSSSAGRFMQFFNKNNAFFIFRPK